MAKNKVSEYSSTAASNTDIGGIDIAEGCAPSGINNAIRELMAQVKDMQTGADGDPFAVGGNLTVTGTTTLTGAVTATSFLSSIKETIYPIGSIYISTVSTNPSTLLGIGTWIAYGTGRALVAIDTGNALMNVVGKIFGVTDAIVPSHSHTATSTVTDPSHSHVESASTSGSGGTGIGISGGANFSGSNIANISTQTSITGITAATSLSTTGVSVINQNYQPSIAVYIWNRTA